VKKVASIMTILALLAPASGYSDHSCPEAVKGGKEAYRFAKKAYKAESFVEAKSYAKQAERGAEEAKVAADKCGCEKAEKNFDEAHEYAEKARKADSQADVYKYAEKAMQEAKEGIDRAKHCR
jgi:valyl-tRNA synthetase